MILSKPSADLQNPSRVETKNRLGRWFFSLAVVGLIMVLSVPIFIRSGKINNQSVEVSNIRQIHMALFEFDNEYGSFPGENTIPLVESKTGGKTFKLGTHFSNDYFRQLLAAGIGNEKMFHANVQGARKPDDRFAGARALEKGECGFCYIPGFSSSSNSSYPIVIAGLIPGTDRLDKEALDGKIVFLRIDGSAATAKTDSEGHMVVFGKRLLDAENPIWEGRKPLIAWPEPGEPEKPLIERIFR